MKRSVKYHYCLPPVLFTAILLLTWNTHQTGIALPEKWNGTVSFSSSGTGPFIVNSEWRMDCTFRNSSGPVVHSFKYQSKHRDDEVSRNCSTTSDGRLAITFDDQKATYTIMVMGIRDCVGTETNQGEQKEFRVPGGDTAIIIPDQPIGRDRNNLTGSFTHKEGPHGKGLFETIAFKWDLVKVAE